jgi:phosphoglycerol transferase
MATSELLATAPARNAGGLAPILETWKNVAGYAATLVAVLAVMTVTLQLWRADLRVPFVYQNDNLMGQMFVQNVLETGSVYDGARIGAPDGQDMRDYPLPDVLHLGIIKLMGYAFHDSGLVLNLFYLLCFPLTALSAYFVLRRFRLGRTAALTVAVLYACLPYHYARMGGHLFLAAYYLLPLMIWLLVRIYLGRYPLICDDSADGKPRWRFLAGEAAGAALICVLTGLAGVYYAFFSCFFLLAVGIKAAFRERRWTPVIVSAFLVLLISGALGAALAPSFLYQARHGKNAGPSLRVPGEADVHALTINELLLPIEGHRSGAFRRLRERFLAPPRRPTGESWSVPLGLTGSLGFLYLLGRFLWHRRDKIERTADALAYLNIVAVLLGTVGGLGSCFNLYVTPMIRCYNRLSVFIAFFALAGLFLLLQRLAGHYDRNVWTRFVRNAGLLVLLVLGILDQTSPQHTPAYAKAKREYQSDEDFGRRMEAALPPGAIVYQMPYFAFPEAGLVQGLGDYELLRPYFHTRSLRFTYGAMRNRGASNWLAAAADKPMPEALEALAVAGFRGVYLDRAGFADSGASAEAELARLLGAGPLVSQSGRQVFFDMTSYVSALRARFTDTEWEAKSEEASHPLEADWAGACYEEEKAPNEGTWRWCGAKGQLNLRNLRNRPRRVIVKMSYVGWQDKPARLTLDGDLCRRQLTLTTARQPLELELVVPPGDHSIAFACDGPRMPLPIDARTLVFRVCNFEYRVEGE